MRTVLFALLCSIAATAPAQEPKRELIYGAEMMTRAEREDYRQDLQRAKTEEEATKVRTRHQDQMQRRARARGEKLDDIGLVIKEKDTEKAKGVEKPKEAKK